MTFEEIMANTASTENTDDMVERIAMAWFRQPCPPEEGHCNPEVHIWEDAHPEDQQYALDMVRFVLREAGIG